MAYLYNYLLKYDIYTLNETKCYNVDWLHTHIVLLNKIYLITHFIFYTLAEDTISF